MKIEKPLRGVCRVLRPVSIKWEKHTVRFKKIAYKTVHSKLVENLFFKVLVKNKWPNRIRPTFPKIANVYQISNVLIVLESYSNYDFYVRLQSINIKIIQA